MIITVEARHGKDVPSLHPEDVLAYERDQRLRVTDVVPLQGEHAGLELFLLLDDASNTSLGSQFGDLRQFIESLPATTSVGVAYMHHGTVDIAQNMTADRSRAAEALRLPLFSGGPSPYLSLSDLIKRWPGNSARREVVLVTSGADSLGGTVPMNPYLDTAIKDAQRNGIVVYAIYMPSAGHAGHSLWRMNWAQSHLAQIAEETGGEAYMLGFGPPISLAPYLEDIAERLAHQYRVTVQFRPASKASLHDVRFVTEVPNAELVSASRVYVPTSR
ncbi:MAG: hypothetical protein LAP61_22675 [Acidobacteriia bacterium]|nr:hypothetical protein [Terriglobia bacterium]